jgi:hypothetical protein
MEYAKLIDEIHGQPIDTFEKVQVRMYALATWLRISKSPTAKDNQSNLIRGNDQYHQHS